jgi:hypothetical protein
MLAIVESILPRISALNVMWVDLVLRNPDEFQAKCYHYFLGFFPIPSRLSSLDRLFVTASKPATAPASVGHSTANCSLVLRNIRFSLNRTSIAIR